MGLLTVSRPIGAQQLQLSDDYTVSALSGHPGVATAVLDFETVPITGLKITQKASAKYWPCDLEIHHNKDPRLIFAEAPKQGPIRSYTDDFSLYYQWCGGTQISLGPGGGTGAGSGRQLEAEHPGGYYLQSIRVCTNRRENNRIKGIQTSAVRAVLDETSGRVLLQDVSTTSDTNPNCTDWHPIVRCSRENGEVASGLRIRYNTRSDVKHSFTGLELICRHVSPTGVATSRSALEQAPSLSSLDGSWEREDSNNPRNNGMRITVEGGTATLTAMPATGSRKFSVGQLLWQDLSADGTVRVRGSSGAYYPAHVNTEGPNRLHIDIDSNGAGNDQTWVRAGPSIDGDWVLVSSRDDALPDSFRGMQIRVEGGRATVQFLTAVAARSFRVGDEVWRSIQAKSPPEDAPLPKAVYPAGALEYQGTSRRGWRNERFWLRDDGNELQVGIGDSQLWARPSVADELIAAAERGEQLLELPQEPVDDPYAAGNGLERPGGERTVDVPEELPPPAPEPEEEVACLSSSLRFDDMDLQWGWGVTAPKPSAILLESALVTLPTNEREEYEIALALPRYDGASRHSGMVIDMERSLVPDLDPHDAFIWRGNAGGRPWRHEPRLKAEELRARITNYRDDDFRFRPIDIEGYATPGGVRFTAVWIRNLEGFEWRAEFDLTSSEYGALYRQYREDGFRLTDIEVYRTPSGLRYAGIWVKSCDNDNWRQYRNLTGEQLEARDRELGTRTFKLVDFESYRSSQGQRYAAIWEKVPHRAWSKDYDLELEAFLNRYHRLTDAGFRLIDYESYETPNGIRYAGVWAENAPRYRYQAKNTINDSIDSYRLQNDVPGVSVVIIQDGDVVYRRGFGFADREAGKEAHAETVYLTASVSKVIGATMAASLEERGVGGLDLTAKTKEYLGEPAAEYLDDDAMKAQCGVTTAFWFCKRLPEKHDHTVEQLMAKIGCVRHYRDTMPVNTSNYYKWRGQALVQMWDRPLLTNCKIGQHYRYSTHGFTFVGGALEAATGEPVADLVDDFAQRNDLPTMRAMYTGSGSLGFPANYDRAQAYTLSGGRPPPSPDNKKTNPNVTNNPTVVATRENTSWKVLGGGIEMSALDLARFGWKLLNNEIVSAATRKTLWTPLITSGSNSGWNSVAPNPVPGGNLPSGTTGIGRAWELGGTAGGGNGRWVLHRGDGTGAGSILKIWRDQNIVIAMLSNRRFYNKGRDSLVNQLATIVRNSTPP